MMRKASLAVLAAGLFSFSSSAWCQISLIQVTPCGQGAFPGTTCIIPATGPGHLIVVGWQTSGGDNTSTTISSITDNAGNIYTEAGPARSIQTGIQSVEDIWYAKNSVSGATSVTITPSANIASAGALIWEFSGVDPNAPLDQTTVLNTQAGTATTTGAAVTITSPNEVVVSLSEVSGTVTGILAGNPFISDSSAMGNGWAHLITSAVGTYSAQWGPNGGGYASSTASFKAASSGTPPAGTPLNPCDLALPYGTINQADVTAALNMVLNVTPCTANIDGAGVCNVTIVQRVVDASLPNGTCLLGNSVTSHSVTLSWVAGTATPPALVAGYNIYRGAVSGGPYTKLTTSVWTNGSPYTDSSVQAGQTYYYVATTVDTTGNESAFSTPPIPAVIPSP